MILCAPLMVNETLTEHDAARAAHCQAGNSLFRGIKRQDWRARPDAARKLGRKLAERGEVAYWVASPENDLPEGKRREQRRGAREPLRLRSAKLLDARYRFVCECRICDRSPTGLRLALARNVALPPCLAVHIDETSEVRCAKVIWRRGRTVGIRLSAVAPGDALRPGDRYALRERYYAILD
jgi:hypothetical protein